MKINARYVFVMAVLGLGVATAACDDDGDDNPDANVSDGSVDSNTADVLIKFDANKTDGGADANKTDGGADANKDSATDDASSNTGGDAAPVASACSDYCDKIGTNCTDLNKQYGNKGECMSACQNKLAWPAGTVAHTGNTLSCRDYHAGAAAGSAANATLHCPHAGPTGADVCGNFCENYCYLASKNCTGTNALYADNAACVTACSGTNGSGGFATTGNFGDIAGNTLQCRLYHVNAARGDANLHCPHASATPTAPCVN